jgi:hypothetical protein
VADYERAGGLRKKYSGLTVGDVGPATSVGNTHRLWYRRSVTGGYEFMVVNAETQAKEPLVTCRDALGGDWRDAAVLREAVALAERGQIQRRPWW